jgi:cell division protein FtsB
MALAVRSDAPARSLRPEATRTTTPNRPHLTVVPRRRRVLGIAVLVSAFVATAMLGAAAFQVYLARAQLQIDQLDRQIRDTSARYEQLRLERAELRSPGNLQAIAEQWQLRPDDSASFMVLGPDVLAVAKQSSSLLDPGYSSERELLEQFRTVKAFQGSAP